ncbi:MAG: ATP-binding protein, partial [Thaumarchaeota archaeon]|nr:ATP-binding protein [Nitrososphaerota archaeon]
MSRETHYREKALESLLSQPKVGFSLDELDGLTDFLRSKGCALLIKGYAGAGKTTLAAELLYHYGKGAYVSSRVSETKIQTQLPLFKEIKRNQDFADVRLGNASTI